MRELIVTITAFLAAALSTTLVLAFIVIVRDPYVEAHLRLVLLLFGYSLVPASAFVVLFVVLRSVHALRWWSAAIGGVVVGVLLWTVFPGVNVWPLLRLWVIVGAVTGLVFWAVWRTGMRHRTLGVEAPSSNHVPSA
jgi:hypothetical protein